MKFSALDLIEMIKRCLNEERITIEEAQMIKSFLAHYLMLQIEIEEYKFKLNIK